MSRTAAKLNNRPMNPMAYFVNFNGEGNFGYWEQRTKVKGDFGNSISFVLMDTRSCISGFSKAANAKVYSNRVRSLTKEKLVVRAVDTVIAEGLYADIKNDVKAAGGKFCVEAYVLMVNGDGEMVPVTISFTGEALRCWMEFMDNIGGKYAAYNYLVTASKGEEKKAGKNSYYAVKFDTVELNAELSDAANAFNDDKLQPFLGPVEDEAEAVAVLD